MSDQKNPAIPGTRRADSNRRPLHYEGRPTMGTTGKRVLVRARFSCTIEYSGGCCVSPVDARGRSDVPLKYPHYSAAAQLPDLTVRVPLGEGRLDARDNLGICPAAVRPRL